MTKSTKNITVEGKSSRHENWNRYNKENTNRKFSKKKIWVNEQKIQMHLLYYQYNKEMKERTSGVEDTIEEIDSSVTLNAKS